MEFKKSLNLGTKSTTKGRGSSSKKVTISQVGPNGENLEDIVNEQHFSIDGEKHSLKLRSAYHKDTPFCTFTPNEDHGETDTRYLPPKRIKIKDINNVEELDPSVVEAEDKNGRVPDPDYKKVIDGEVAEENVLKDGKWVKAEYKVPVYRQFLDNRGNPLKSTETRLQDDDGRTYVLTNSKYHYYSANGLVIFNGYEVTPSGTKVQESEGTYITMAHIDDDSSIVMSAQKSGGKFSVKQYLTSVFMHSEYGVVGTTDLIDGDPSKGLRKGSMSFNGGRGVTAAALTGDGEAIVLDDRKSWRLSDWKSIRRRSTVAEEAQEAKEVLLNEAAKEESNDVEEDSFI